MSKFLGLMLVVLLVVSVSHVLGTIDRTELPWGSQQLPIRMGQYRQLFIDDYVIAQMQGVKQVLNQPQKHPLNPLVVPDRPWEGNGVLNPGVLYDENKRIFTMRYKVNYPEAARVCHAVSNDGIHWEKPNLGLVEFEGSKANNLFLEKPEGPQGLHTPWDPDPQKQYKKLAGRRGPGMFSPDGIHWTTPSGSNIIYDVASDSSVMITYDHFRGRYVGFSKTTQVSAGHARRCRGITFSDDFLEWTPMKAFLVPDARDDELARQRVAALQDRVMYNDGPEWHLAQFYYMRQVPYEGMYLGLLQVFDISGWYPGMERRPSTGGEDGPAYYELTSSRDREHWNRVCNRDIFLPLGEAGTWEAGYLDFPHIPVIVGDEIWIYYGARQTTHSTPWWRHSQPDQAAHEAEVARLKKRAEEKGKKYSAAAIGLATLRLDGWVSVDAGPEGGTLTTKSVVFEPGNKLVINARAPKGSVAVEILYPTGETLPGFAKSDSDVFSGDAIRHTVTWNGQADLSEVADKPVSLRFYLRDAKLFSFTVSQKSPR